MTNTNKINKSGGHAQREHQHRGASSECALIVAVETRVRALVVRYTELPEVEQVAPSDRSSAIVRQRHAAVEGVLVEGLPSRAHVSRDFGRWTSAEAWSYQELLAQICI